MRKHSSMLCDIPIVYEPDIRVLTRKKRNSAIKSAQPLASHVTPEDFPVPAIAGPNKASNLSSDNDNNFTPQSGKYDAGAAAKPLVKSVHTDTRPFALNADEAHRILFVRSWACNQG